MGYESAIALINLSLTALSIIEGFHKPLRLNISDKSGGLLVHVRLHLLSHQLTKFKIPSDSSKRKSQTSFKKKTSESNHGKVKVENKASKSKQPTDIASYKKQRNLVVSLNRHSKLDYFNSVSSSKDTKLFWKQCQSCFSNKHAVGDSAH